jgi:hypothetical protein
MRPRQWALHGAVDGLIALGAVIAVAAAFVALLIASRALSRETAPERPEPVCRSEVFTPEPGDDYRPIPGDEQGGYWVRDGEARAYAPSEDSTPIALVCR